jgi:hypothetical protein
VAWLERAKTYIKGTAEIFKNIPVLLHVLLLRI